MQYCKKCVVPDTKPGVVLDDEGVCQACRVAERKKETDWTERWNELEELCDKHRGSNGEYYDCLVTISGGKDSHYQTWVFKEKMNMNPLLVNVYNWAWTDIGTHNYYNISEVFSCDVLSIMLNRKLAKKFMRKGFEKLGSPNWYWDQAVYAYPLNMAIKLNIPLVVYGENINYEYGGPQKKETYSALDQIYNDVVKNVGWEFWLDDEIKMKDVNFCVYPTKKELTAVKIEPIYLSYFLPWSGYFNHVLAKRYGFKTLGDTWKREGYIEDYEQLDAIGYLVHPWLKYPKYGFARATDIACQWIRDGLITRDDAIQLVKEHDHKLDPMALNDFLNFLGYTEEEFWNIVERFRNKDIFEKKNGKWVLKTMLE